MKALEAGLLFNLTPFIMKHCFDNRIVSAALLAVSIVILGFCVKWGIDDFANKDRKVSVKGLSEREVDADDGGDGGRKTEKRR